MRRPDMVAQPRTAARVSQAEFFAAEPTGDVLDARLNSTELELELGTRRVADRSGQRPDVVVVAGDGELDVRVVEPSLEVHSARELEAEELVNRLGVADLSYNAATHQPASRLAVNAAPIVGMLLPFRIYQRLQ